MWSLKTQCAERFIFRNGLQAGTYWNVPDSIKVKLLGMLLMTKKHNFDTSSTILMHVQWKSRECELEKALKFEN